MDSRSIRLNLTQMGLGDIVMISGLIKVLQDKGYTICCVASKKTLPVIKHNTSIDKIIIDEDQPVPNKGIVLSGPPGFAKIRPFIINFLPFCAKKLVSKLHFIEAYAKQLKTESCKNLVIVLPDHIDEWGKAYQDSVIIHPFGVSSVYRTMPPRMWEELANEISKKYKLKVYAFGTPDEGSKLKIPLINCPDINYAFAALKHCKVFIGVDSVFNHACRALNKEAIIVWGSTHPLNLGYESNINIVNGEIWQPDIEPFSESLWCQPCYRFYNKSNPIQPLPCFNKTVHTLKDKSKVLVHKCMANNTTDVILAAMSKLLSNQQ